MNKQDLKQADFSFNKKFGQNFIFDQNLLKAIVCDSKISKNDEVLEIGPGAGTLTKIIAQNCKKVVSYEIDKNLEPILAQNLKEQKNSTIIFADALKTDIESIEKNFENKYKIVANIPYYITTPLIFKFVENSKKVESLTLMVQKEVAERLTAKPNTSIYGAITATLNFYGNIKILRQVPRHLFTPAPNVDSAVIQIEIIPNKYDVNEKSFKEIVKYSFLNRRKTLLNNLKPLGFSREQVTLALKEMNLNENIRGEILSTNQFVELTQLLCKQKI